MSFCSLELITPITYRAFTENEIFINGIVKFVKVNTYLYIYKMVTEKIN